MQASSVQDEPTDLKMFDPQSSSGPCIHGYDERFHVSESLSPPYKWICYLEIESDSGIKKVGTGFKINVDDVEVGHQIILTSAHCTYIAGDEFNPGKLAKKITVYFPGQAPQVATSAANQLWACPEYIQYIEEDKHRASQDNDYGLIKLQGSSKGGFGWSARTTCNKLWSHVVSNCGYPGVVPEKGVHFTKEETCNSSIDTKYTRGLWIAPATMWITGGEITHVTDERVFYKNDTTGGQSGSPVYTWYKGYWTAVAIHSYGGELNSGTRIRPEMIKKITEYLEVCDWGLLYKPKH